MARRRGIITLPTVRDKWVTHVQLLEAFKTAGIDENEVPDDASDTAQDSIQLLLANKWNPNTDPTGWWMSEKLDGVRAYWNGR